jgi:4'-phosphopantetheinyl transferase
MERFRLPMDRRMYGASHAMVRKVLSRYVDAPPESLRFSRGGQGKPALIGTPNCVEFNLTHTRGLAVLAVSLSRAVGIDAERGDRSINEALAERIFSDTERRDLSELPAAARARAMVRLWTLKEAYVKALGVGLSRSVWELTFRLSETGPPRFDPAPSIDGDPGRWGFVEVHSRRPYVVSLAVENPDRSPLVIHHFDGAPLLRED